VLDFSLITDGRSEGEGDESEDEAGVNVTALQEKMRIQDETNTNLVNLRRAIYLVIMSSLNFEECAHKLAKMSIRTPFKYVLRLLGQRRTSRLSCAT
jgi:hypothetical protein